MNNAKTFILIPAYLPNQELVTLLNSPRLQPYSIVVINDGSPADSEHVFEALTHLPNVQILHHSINRGKGAAIKTGIDYIRRHHPHAAGIITADADGQHKDIDIIKLAEKSILEPEAFILGTRDFSEQVVPLRSRFGNQITRSLFKLLKGVKISDTQTGLRFIPLSFSAKLLKIPYDRYEFEMEMLLQAIRHKLNVIEVPIATVYIENNKSSHFSPLKDSFRIYYVFFRFGLVALSSALLDVSLFYLALQGGASIPVATFSSRLISGNYNFFLVRKLVFRSSGGITWKLISYWCLALVLATSSSYLVSKLAAAQIFNPVVAKLLVESVLFVFSFSVQKTFIFFRSNNE